jgi:hypothetical protein
VAGWLREIAVAYVDALETIPFSKIINEEIHQHDLFHLAPLITLKMRGIKRTKKLQKRVTEAALASYVVNQEDHKDALSSPIISFSFCYLASHYVLDLVSEESVEEVMTVIEKHPERLEKALMKHGNT